MRRKKKTTWEAFLEKYKQFVIYPKPLESAEMELRIIERFHEIAKFQYINDVKLHHVDLFISERRAQRGRLPGSTVSAATINKDLRYIRSALRRAYDWEMLDRVPRIRDLREMERAKSFISEAEFSAIYRACPNQWWKSFVLFQFLTGWRVGQVLRLRWFNIDLNTGEIFSDAFDNKGKRDLIIPLHPAIRESLNKLRDEGKKSDFVFAFRKDLRSLRDKFHAIQKKAGIIPRNTHDRKWYGFHDLRRGFATANVANLDIFELKTLMQHRSISTTQRYIAMATRLSATMEKIAVPNLDD